VTEPTHPVVWFVAADTYHVAWFGVTNPILQRAAVALALSLVAVAVA
jgi:hypothetical protein